MRIALLLAAACLPAFAQSINKPTQPSHYLEFVGCRAAILGREDGTFEAWIYPIKLVRDFRLSVSFDGSLTLAPVQAWAAR